jgi:hypothetical protein
VSTKRGVDSSHFFTDHEEEARECQGKAGSGEGREDARARWAHGGRLGSHLDFVCNDYYAQRYPTSSPSHLEVLGCTSLPMRRYTAGLMSWAPSHSSRNL